MTRICLYRTIGIVIAIVTAVALATACVAQDEGPARRHVSPRLIVKVPRGSMDGLDSVTYGPAGQLVVSGQWDGQVRVHDPVTGKELRRIDVGPSHSAWVAFSPDGRRMVCAVGYAIRKFPLLDFESGKILKTFEGQGHGSRLAVFSPDGRQILTSHAGLWNYNRSEVVCWDAASGERIKQFCLGTDEPVYCARFSPNGQWILTSQRRWRSNGDYRSSARIWSVAEGKMIHTFADPERFLEDAIFSPDGKTVLAACGEIAVLWDALSGTRLRSFVGHRAKIESISFSPDGTRVLTGSADRTAGVWETATGSRVGTIPVVVGIVNNVAFSPDGRSAAVGIRRRGVVEVWDLEDVKLGSAGPPIRAFQMHPFRGTREEALAVLRKSNTRIDTTADGRIRSMTLPQNHIPDETFACVARFPELEQLTINFADVDDLRLQYLAGLSNLKRLVLHDTDISDEGLAIVGRFTSLEHLDLSESRLVGWGFAHLKSLDNLTSLDLNRNWWLSGVALEQLHPLKRLERLDLSGNDRIRPEAFRHLARVSSLKHLNVGGTLFDDEAMRAIAKLSRLQALELRDRTRVTAQGVRNLAGSPVATLCGPDLKENEIGSLGGLTKLSSYYRLWPVARDSDLPSLVRLKKLSELRVHVTGAPAGAAGGASIGELQGLETLHIWGDPKADWTILGHLPRVSRLTQLSLFGVPDESLATMPRLERLEILDLSRCNIHRGGLACLGRLPRLRRLLLNPQTLNDDDLEALALSKSLVDLCLSGQSTSSPHPLPSSEPRTLTEKSLKHLAARWTLRQLDLTNLSITDQGLAPLAKLGRLEQLRLDNTKITDAGLKHLEGMPEMRWLSFSGTTVSREAAARLQRDHMPACHIDDNWCNDGCLFLPPLVKSPVKEPKSSK